MRAIIDFSISTDKIHNLQFKHWQRIVFEKKGTWIDGSVEEINLDSFPENVVGINFKVNKDTGLITISTSCNDNEFMTICSSDEVQVIENPKKILDFLRRDYPSVIADSKRESKIILANIEHVPFELSHNMFLTPDEHKLCENTVIVYNKTLNKIEIIALANGLSSLEYCKNKELNGGHFIKYSDVEDEYQQIVSNDVDLYHEKIFELKEEFTKLYVA